MAVGTIGKYERLDVLGHGASGVVYLAWDTLLRRQVALKEIRAAGPEMDRVLDEARVLDRLRHPHIVRVNSVDREGGAVLIDMELVRGRNLADVLRERGGEPMPPDEAVRITLDVLDALGYAHQQRIIHRDIKPGNILIGENGVVKLTDFGLAEALGSHSVAGGGGTYPYMAPEDFAEDAASDYRADLWAVGVVLYEMLTGRRPFAVARSKDPFAWKRAIEQDEPGRASVANPDLSSTFDEVLTRALAKSKTDRFQTAPIFADSLRAAFTRFRQSADASDLTAGRVSVTVAEEAAQTPIVALAIPLVKPYASDARDGREPTFFFANGGAQARDLDELLALSAKHWDEARRALADGRFALFLRAIGEVYIADLAQELAGRTDESDDRRLREFLDRSAGDDDPGMEPGTIPLGQSVRRAINEAGQSGANRFRRRVPSGATIYDKPASTAAAAPAMDQTILAPRPFVAPPAPTVVAPPPPDRRAEREAERTRRRDAKSAPPPVVAATVQAPVASGNAARWWFWPLLALCVAPPTVALYARLTVGGSSAAMGRYNDIFEAWTATGILSAMLLLVGVGAKIPTMARIVCLIPVALGLLAAGAIASVALGAHPNTDALVRVGLASVFPLFVLLVEASTARSGWRTWAWVTLAAAVIAAAYYARALL